MKIYLARLCIAFDDTSKTVSGVYDWIRHLEYICIADSIEDAKRKALIVQDKNNDYVPPCFSLMEEIMKTFVNV